MLHRLRDFDAEQYMIVDQTGTHLENSFGQLARFVADEQDALFPASPTVYPVVSLSCGITPRTNVTLKQIIRSFQNIKRFFRLFVNVMNDVFELEEVSLMYVNNEGESHTIKLFYARESCCKDPLSIYYGTLYDFAADITGDTGKYSRKNLERYADEANEQNPGEYTRAISDRHFTPEFLKRIAERMQADKDFKWTIAAYNAKDSVNSFPQIVISVQDVSDRKNSIVVLRNRMHKILDSFTYHEQKEMSALFNNIDHRKRSGIWIYLVYEKDLPKSQCSENKNDYQFSIQSQNINFTVNVLNYKYYQFSNSHKAEEYELHPYDVPYTRRYTTIERIVSNNDLKKLEDPQMLERIQGPLQELQT